MPNSETAFVSPYQTRNAMKEFWNAWCTCQMNVLYHRRRAGVFHRRIRLLDICSLSLAAVAGLGVLAGIKAIPDTVWAVIAFASGIIGQLRSIFRWPDNTQEEQALENDYISVLVLLKRFLDDAKHLNGITDDLFAHQFQRALERFNSLTLERDKTDYKNEETEPLWREVLEQFPPTDQWMPDSAIESRKEDANIDG
ncbi:MAG: hypothetical protein JOZ62_03860 [Acidobacteriaceae bacterium]|nr:hypothetical protein [Acidobacteriaceae bacterium]